MENLNGILQEFKEVLNKVAEENKLNDVKIRFLGKNGVLTEALKKIKDVPADEKKSYGEKINKIKAEIENIIDEKIKEFQESRINNEILNAKVIDLTTPRSSEIGSLHPITVTQKKICEIFKSMGFVVEDGNEIETEFNNFEAVNVPKNHPARDMQDTFYLENGEVLKTQTSAGQNRIMRKYGAPLKAIFPGRCFRNEELDASHENTFFQLEGMMIDKNVSIANLIYFMKTMLSSIFKKEVDVRLRPGFFPFVEPGFELDCKCPYCDGKGCNVCKQGGWIELCPCGMIHENVLKMGGIDPEVYQGFAFGLGFTRLAMMSYEIPDIRILNSGKLQQLKQTKLK